MLILTSHTLVNNVRWRRRQPSGQCLTVFFIRGFTCGRGICFLLDYFVALLLLETWTETPILPKPPFSYRRLSTSLWVFDTYNVPYIVV